MCFTFEEYLQQNTGRFKVFQCTTSQSKQSHTKQEYWEFLAVTGQYDLPDVSSVRPSGPQQEVFMPVRGVDIDTLHSLVVVSLVVVSLVVVSLVVISLVASLADYPTI